MSHSISSNISKDPRKIQLSRSKLIKGENFEDFVLLDCVFGIPLFSEQLNEEICRRIRENNLLAFDHLDNVKFANHNIVEQTVEFVKRFRGPGYQSPFANEINAIPYPTEIVTFDSNMKLSMLEQLF